MNEHSEQNPFYFPVRQTAVSRPAWTALGWIITGYDWLQQKWSGAAWGGGIEGMGEGGTDTDMCVIQCWNPYDPQWALLLYYFNCWDWLSGDKEAWWGCDLLSFANPSHGLGLSGTFCFPKRPGDGATPLSSVWVSMKMKSRCCACRILNALWACGYICKILGLKIWH